MVILYLARPLPLCTLWTVLRPQSRTVDHDGSSRSIGKMLQRDYGNIDRGGGGDAD
jgi:hypothetical protein